MLNRTLSLALGLGFLAAGSSFGSNPEQNWVESNSNSALLAKKFSGDPAEQTPILSEDTKTVVRKAKAGDWKRTFYLKSQDSPNEIIVFFDHGNVEFINGAASARAGGFKFTEKTVFGSIRAIEAGEFNDDMSLEEFRKQLSKFGKIQSEAEGKDESKMDPSWKEFDKFSSFFTKRKHGK